ncbi:hypothetical protein SDRG_09316 [Saprolegnia diclina VS20]|uniref:Uncharacterized protein n=1 Tax=Saprolegnia diclina (strain VS20) TaxID=1156394 RepID=T0QHZ7_SAPDV|nr:hypothetical protein SDRG_09316 [Saprolegnia diclina VS20]EQC33340.1 hypothetical protein SDRG_09316 [Saprolegnia diclina VS20]|eukprot:XP_008613463.1 hypothetical protein SDRG_09316 [Saprolegnia diclina VS20]
MCSSTISRPLIFVDDALHATDAPVTFKAMDADATSSEGNSDVEESSSSTKSSPPAKHSKTIKDVALGSLFQHLKDIDLNDSDKAAFALDSFRHRLETLRTTKRRRRSTSSSPKIEPEEAPEVVAPKVPMARVTLPQRHHIHTHHVHHTTVEPCVEGKVEATIEAKAAAKATLSSSSSSTSSDDDEKKHVHFADEVHPVAHVDMSKHHASRPRHFAPFVPSAPYVRPARVKHSAKHQQHAATQQAIHELHNSLKGMLFPETIDATEAPEAHVPKPHVRKPFVPPVVVDEKTTTTAEDEVKDDVKVEEPVRKETKLPKVTPKVHIGGKRDCFDEETATAPPKIHCPSIHPHEYPEFNLWYMLFLAFLVVYVTMHQ